MDSMVSMHGLTWGGIEHRACLSRVEERTKRARRSDCCFKATRAPAQTVPICATEAISSAGSSHPARNGYQHTKKRKN